MLTFALMRSFARQLKFSLAITERDLRSLYKGSVLGLSWLFLRPLIYTVGYVLIIMFVLRVRPAGGAGALDYTLHILAGMIAWQPLQRSLEEAPSLVRERMEMLRQIVYPIETLPVSSITISLIPAGVTFLIYAALAALQTQLTWSVLLLPIPVLLLTVLLTGAAWIFMVGGVVVRDLREVVAVIMGILVFLSPVLLTPEMTGETLWNIILLNPLAHVVLCFRDVLQGTFHPVSWIVFVGLTGVIFLSGAFILARVKLMIYELI